MDPTLVPGGFAVRIPLTSIGSDHSIAAAAALQSLISSGPGKSSSS
jgi:hypothetical protein